MTLLVVLLLVSASGNAGPVLRPGGQIERGETTKQFDNPRTGIQSQNLQQGLADSTARSRIRETTADLTRLLRSCTSHCDVMEAIRQNVVMGLLSPAAVANVNLALAATKKDLTSTGQNSGPAFEFSLARVGLDPRRIKTECE